MIIGRVIGNVWATRKDESLNGLKLLVVETIDYGRNQTKEPFVAIDSVGAGIGDQVLVVKGSSARKVLQREDAAVDATVVGIIDEVEVTLQNNS
ncbi:MULTISPECIES: EutN/CcmL family microcompartment protein [Clostridium]|uniref:Propanediol utilization protein, carboxysome structural protein n=2 Tax=Clostridium TaxID=1485 RepID=A0A0D8IEI5_9CLOT|nr:MULTISPECIES: EutN/CcmL family microcompartment protein [Clostridium]AKL93923.1 propanediol utilization protein, carboxysome structural protein [Clostridium aceticum]AOY75796.1 ethanolamine utilization protein EutN [Clostridium formicaceticum]ARE86125.1 Ethanolamine utilization protein EutN [Clostridium formicaceticum]KJF28688.1 ethanolamine utilization protein EutN [Clostridium aceticum]